MTTATLFRDGFHSTATLLKVNPASVAQLRNLGYTLVHIKHDNKEK